MITISSPFPDCSWNYITNLSYHHPHPLFPPLPPYLPRAKQTAVGVRRSGDVMPPANWRHQNMASWSSNVWTKKELHVQFFSPGSSTVFPKSMLNFPLSATTVVQGAKKGFEVQQVPFAGYVYCIYALVNGIHLLKIFFPHLSAHAYKYYRSSF